MPANSLPYIKGAIRKALQAIFDRELTPPEKKAIKDFFGYSCAYCGLPIEEGDMDHLVSGGTNHISNRVFSCKRCNAHEKRDMDWVEFLQRKCGDDKIVYEQRHERIMRWINENGRFILSEGKRKALDEEVARVTSEMDLAANRLRALK